MQPATDVRLCCRVNLNAAHIVEQVIVARRLLAADAALLPADQAPSLTNVVSLLHIMWVQCKCLSCGWQFSAKDLGLTESSVMWQVFMVRPPDPPLANPAQPSGRCC